MFVLETWVAQAETAARTGAHSALYSSWSRVMEVRVVAENLETRAQLEAQVAQDEASANAASASSSAPAPQRRRPRGEGP